ncbi:hypothetical protein KBD34_01695 [Patescibacteria group bacterium]|nr:hypothetical protein [Patescibacteria group bacterium]
MKSVDSILYEEILSSSLVSKVATASMSLIGLAFGVMAWTLFITGVSYGPVFAILLFAILFLASVVGSIKKVMTNGRILVTSDGLKLAHGKQEVYFAREDMIQFQKKTLQGYSHTPHTPHVFEKDGDISSRAIACQIFPDTPFPSSEGVFLLTKKTKPSSGGLFGTRILSELPFFIPTRQPYELISALQKTSSLRGKSL